MLSALERAAALVTVTRGERGWVVDVMGRGGVVAATRAEAERAAGGWRRDIAAALEAHAADAVREKLLGGLAEAPPPEPPEDVIRRMAAMPDEEPWGQRTATDCVRSLLALLDHARARLAALTHDAAQQDGYALGHARGRAEALRQCHRVVAEEVLKAAPAAPAEQGAALSAIKARLRGLAAGAEWAGGG